MVPSSEGMAIHNRGLLHSNYYSNAFLQIKKKLKEDCPLKANISDEQPQCRELHFAFYYTILCVHAHHRQKVARIPGVFNKPK